MKNKRALLIINPISGTRSKRGVDEFVAQRMAAKGFDLECVGTGAPGDACRMAREASEEGYDMVIAAGGDGTVNETASGLTGSSTLLGIIPLGSGNGLARSLNIPLDLRYATKILEDGYFEACDNGVVNGHDFFCTFGVGFDAAVSEKFAREKRRGRATYVKNVLLEYMKYSPEAYSISIGDKVITDKAFLVAVCNAPQYGNNAYIAPQAKLNDGLLDIIVAHKGDPISNVIAGMELFTGRLDKNTLIDSFRVSSAVISRQSDEPAHIDGEPVRLGTVLDIQCRPSSLRILVPQKEHNFKPVISPILSALTDIHYDLRALLGIR